jgi:LPXTG-motif cell wall-anchored protein
MKRLSIKKLFIVLAIIATIILIATNVHATGGIVNPIDIIGTGTSANTTGTTSTTTNTTLTTTTVNVVSTNTATTTTTNTLKTNTTTTTTSSNLPQTGDASDYIIFLFIAVCLVVSIYAYRKFRNYNI